MAELKDLFQSADFKTEKHAPVIELPQAVKKGEVFKVCASVGKEIAHPNTTAHHIRWIELYFQPEGEKFPFQVARAEFTCHGEGLQGADSSTVYTAPAVSVSLKSDKSGTLYASSYCNIHGLWQSAAKVSVE
ncbi:class II SORL domain-containing protein [bacterium]|nr:class II SORL domain-containing protein [bacterium]